MSQKLDTLKREVQQHAAHARQISAKAVLTPIDVETIRRQRQVIVETHQNLSNLKATVATRKIEIKKELDWQRKWQPTGVDFFEGFGAALVNAYDPLPDERNHSEIVRDAEAKRKAIEDALKLLESCIASDIDQADQLLGSADDYLNNPDKVKVYLEEQTKAFNAAAKVIGTIVGVLSAFLLFNGVRSKPASLGLTVSGGLAGITAVTCLIFSREQKQP